MRWSLARMLYFVTAVAIGLAIYSQIWIANLGVDRMVLALGGYVGLLTTSTLVAFTSPPVWKKFWTAFALFGWCYFVFVLRAGFLVTPDPYTAFHDYSRTIGIGIPMGFVWAFATLAFTRPVKTKKDDDSEGQV